MCFVKQFEILLSKAASHLTRGTCGNAFRDQLTFLAFKAILDSHHVIALPYVIRRIAF